MFAIWVSTSTGQRISDDLWDRMNDQHKQSLHDNIVKAISGDAVTADAFVAKCLPMIDELFPKFFHGLDGPWTGEQIKELLHPYDPAGNEQAA